MIIWGVIAGMLTFALLASGIVYFNLKYQKKLLLKQEELHKKESQYQLDLLKNTIESVEKERKRIAGDLHDEIGSQLTAVRLSLNFIKGKAQSPEEFLKSVDGNGMAIDNIINSVRTISHNLLPPGIETFGFVDVVTDLCEKLQNTSGIEIIFTTEYINKRFNDHHEIALFRVMQELLTNSLKHARATKIAVSFIQTPHDLNLIYTDDGIGFPQDINKLNKGLGIKSIEGRITALNGTISIAAPPEKGLKTVIKIPLS